MKKLLALFLTVIVAQLAAQTQKLTFDPPRGFYEAAPEVTITSPVEGTVVKYTLNGEDPLTGKSAVSIASPAKVRIDPNNTAVHDRAPGVCLRAVGVINNHAVTPMVTHTYLFPKLVTELSPDGLRPGPKWPAHGSSVNSQRMDYGMDPDVYNNTRYRSKMQAALLDIPSMSMVMDLDDLFNPATGIFVNATQRGIEWERPCSLELLNPDGSDGFHINCGVRIRGGYSRVGNNRKHAFRYFFRKEYGEGKLNHPLFDNEGVDEFNQIDLAASQNYSWAYGAGSKDGGAERNTFLRDLFSRDLQRDMGQPYTRSRFYHLYINGTYWGLFYTQERSEADFAADYFGGNAEDYDAIKVDAGYGRPYIIEAANGTLDAWNALWSIAQTGFSDNSVYYRVQGCNPDGTRNPALVKYLDVDNLADYMINSYFVGDFDAPISEFLGNVRPNNFWALFNRVSSDGFKFFRHDAEHTLFNVNEDRTGPFPAGQQREHFNPQWLHQQLTANAEYRLRFADRVYKHFFNDGALTPERNIKRLMARKEVIDNAIIAESARWGDVLREPPYTRDVEWLKEVNYLVNDYFPQRTAIVLNQFIDKGWYPSFDPPALNTRGGIVDKGFQLTMTSTRGRIFYTTDGIDPHNPFAHGGVRIVPLAPTAASKRVLVPKSAVSSNWRSAAAFDDSDWDLCSGAPGGIGYEKTSGYESYITLNVGKYMYQNDTAAPNASCLVRIPFVVNADELAQFSTLILNVWYDDGFVAFLNGTKVLEINAPTDLQWNSTATQNHEAERSESFDLSQYINLLRSGQNLLAVHALNVSLNSSDFIILPELTAGIIESSGTLTAPSAIEYTAPITINQTTQFKARVLHQGQWSALDQITLAIQEDLSSLKVTELHYHPLRHIAGRDTLDGDLFEFIELKNIGGAPLNLTGAKFIKGIGYEFPPQFTAAPNQFIVLCSGSEHFKLRYGFDANGQYSGNLSNAGERIVFVSAAGDTVFNFKYNDKAPWPREPDSTGQSLVAGLARPTGDPNDPSYWTVSSQIHGSPRANDAASPVQQQTETLPTVFRLHQNYPNPFNPQTTIKFDMPKDARVTLTIYNALGQQVAMVIDERLQAGSHTAVWDAAQFAGGVYLARLQSDGFSQTIKLLLIK